ncbi:MAG: efflux RND transporter periplasmic adaptor subunit [Gemmatimonadales bacterium]
MTLTPEQASSARLSYAVVARSAAAGGLTATAEIAAAPGRLARVGSRVAGRVSRVLAAEGDRVPAGAALALVDAPELAEATAHYLAANTEAQVARETANRERDLFERRISSEREWRQAEVEAVRAEASKEAAEGRLHGLGLSDPDLASLQVVGHYKSEVAIRTPIAGIVASRTVDVGQVVQPGEALYEVVDLREVRLVVDIYDEALSSVRAGQPVEVRTTSTGDRVFKGHVASVGAVVERESRTVELQVRLPNPDGLLRPGMFATARLAGVAARGDSGVTVIPEAAVQRDDEASIVFVPAGPGRFVRRVVTLGAPSDSGWVTVTAGVAVGDSVVTTGGFVLKSELRRGELGEGEE